MRVIRGRNFVVFEIEKGHKDALSVPELRKEYLSWTEGMSQKDRVEKDLDGISSLKRGKRWQYEVRQWTGVKRVPERINAYGQLRDYAWVSYAIRW